jgi:hypothetical protein
MTPVLVAAERNIKNAAVPDIIHSNWERCDSTMIELDLAQQKLQSINEILAMIGDSL